MFTGVSMMARRSVPPLTGLPPGPALAAVPAADLPGESEPQAASSPEAPLKAASEPSAPARRSRVRRSIVYGSFMACLRERGWVGQHVTPLVRLELHGDLDVADA